MTTIKLITRNEKISQEVIGILRDYLGRAERGELIAIAVCALEPDNTAVHQASSCDNQITLLGAVTRLLHRMQVNADNVTVVINDHD